MTAQERDEVTKEIVDAAFAQHDVRQGINQESKNREEENKSVMDNYEREGNFKRMFTGTQNLEDRK
jgi:hypothetical protein